MKYLILILVISFSSSLFAQADLIEAAKDVDKGDYVILEVRMQMEDEFQTLEGNESANLSRLALFSGTNAKKELISKGFKGFNDVVLHLNNLKQNGFKLEETYVLKGNSLLITHYVFEKKKR